jgi:DHA3 family tetracycline resistance protein-like MFS transporter
MASSFVRGAKIVRRGQMVRWFFLVSLIVGLSSEAVDRLWTLRILDFGLPELFGTRSPAVWFTVFALIGTLLSLLTSLVVNRVSPERVNSLHPNRLLALLGAAQVVGILGLALVGNLWLALAGLWLRSAAVALAQPIQAAWLNRLIASEARATVLSMNSQVDAVGQIAGGPPLGVLANRTSVSAALVTSAVILSPVVLIYSRLRPSRKPTEPAAVERHSAST